MSGEERVVLLDEVGRRRGTQAKADVHHARTPLHLAFSCYLFAQPGGAEAGGAEAGGAEAGGTEAGGAEAGGTEAGGAQPPMLLTQRAASKRTWPAVWTNACCGHPAPEESLIDAVTRRVREELGVEPTDLRVVLPAFRYRAVMDDGTVENEMCPVLVGRCDPAALDPHPAEVDAIAWVDWAELAGQVRRGEREVSPWCAQQMAALPEDPLGAPEVRAGLPPALDPGRR